MRWLIGLSIMGWLTVRLASHAPLGQTERFPADAAPVAPDGHSANPVVALQARLDQGVIELRFEGGTGYLGSLLAGLDIPVESQIAVFSKTSLQRDRISPSNPRVIYFNDDVTVAWMPGGFIEIAAFDPGQGAAFFVLEQSRFGTARIRTDNQCRICHDSNAALGIGYLVRSIPADTTGMTLPWLGNAVPNHTTPLADRWGGWYVTGQTGSQQHLGNVVLDDARARSLPPMRPPDQSDLSEFVDTSRYLSPYSDVAALLVFEHQMHMANLLNRLGRVARNGTGGFDQAVAAVVDYMLFVDEAGIGTVAGTSGFETVFMARGPFDSRGRSLRELRLRDRLMTYPCSYMIYSAAFDGLPAIAREAVYQRLWQILSGAVDAPRHARLSDADRRAVIEILRDTKGDLPAYFHPDRA